MGGNGESIHFLKCQIIGIDFASNGAWDVHLKIDNGRKKVNQLHSVISNRDINLSARRLLTLSVISIEYGVESMGR